MNTLTRNRRRLLFVLHCFHNRGGTEMHTKLLARSLSAEFEVAILYPERGSLWLRRVNGEGDSDDQAIEYPAATVPFPITPYSHKPSELALATALKDFAPDVIHVQHFIYWPLSLIDQLNATGAPVVISFHDYFPITPYFTMQGAEDLESALSPEYVMRIFGQDVREYLQERLGLLKRSIAGTSMQIAPSHYLAKILGDACNIDLRIVEHGIEPFASPVTPYTGTPFRFGCIGSLLPQKGWRELYEAFPEVRKRHNGVELHFYGGGEEPPSKPYQGAFFHDAYDPVQLPEICSQFNVGVIPSVFAETYALVLSELWQARIPVAASKIGALNERVKPGVNGVLFDAHQPHSIAVALCSFLDSNDWRTWVLPAPRTAQSMVDEYRDIYLELLNR